MNGKELKQIAWDRRLDVLEMVYAARAGHIGGSFSCMDILVTLYYRWFDTPKIIRNEPDRDRFILSKGHCAEALYTVFADLGFFPRAELKTYAAFDTHLAEHPSARVPGIEIGTGALGHGLSAAAGMAYGLKQDGNPARVYVLMGDGEQAEGSVWEAAMGASKYALDNLVLFIDRNGLQISGGTETVMPLEKLEDKYGAFGWRVRRCNGHDPGAILEILRDISSGGPGTTGTPGAPGVPQVIIADTVKGYGSPVLENKAECHHMIPTEEQYLRIKEDIALARRERDHE
jgi:transketolase